MTTIAFRLYVPLAVMAALAPATRAIAQPPEPVSGFVVDVKGAIPFLPNDEAVAAPRETASDLMPSYGLGLDVGAHVFPFRWKVMTFGFGASYHLSRGGRTPETLEGETEPSGPTVETRFKALSSQVSLNFGHRMGWSYLSGGIGQSTFRAWRADRDEEAGDATKTVNYGGGARWFINRHLAFVTDLRFYALNAKEPSTETVGHPRMTFAVITVGVAVR